MLNYLRLTDENDIIKLQAALDSLSNWAANWQLTANLYRVNCLCREMLCIKYW